MRTGLSAGGGMLLGLIVGIILFDHPALGLVFGMLFGAAVAARRRRSSASRSN